MPHLAPVTSASIKAALAQAGLSPRHRWGQNFLVNAAALDRIADLIAIDEGEVILEVGPGLGGLTERLLDRGATVVAAEIDPGLCSLLPRILGEPAALHVVPGDVMASKSALAGPVLEQLDRLLSESGRGTWKVCCNLPYQISSPFLAALVALEPSRWVRAVVMLQKEVAAVVRARPGTADYSALGFLAALYLEVARGPRLGPDGFYPRPEVDSQVVVLTPRMEGRVAPARLLPFVRRLFQGRRKTLRKTVPDAFRAAGVDLPPKTTAESLLAAAGLVPNDRVDGVPPDALERLYRAGTGDGPGS